MTAGYDDLDNVPVQTPGSSPVFASDWNVYVKDNFDSLKFGHVVVSTASSLPSVVEGTMVYVADTNKLMLFNGSAWCEVLDLDNVATIAGARVLRGVPAGIISAYGGLTAPDGWLPCDGAGYAITGTYADLYAAIGTGYGSTGGFQVPDLRGRAAFGYVASSAQFGARTSTEGTTTATARSTAHFHTIADHTHSNGSLFAADTRGGGISYYQTGGSAGWYNNNRASIGAPVADTNSFTGGIKVLGDTSGSSLGAPNTSTAANPVPYAVVNYIIKY